MKVVYLIRVFTNHGVGGHYYSLKTTAEAMDTVIDPVIISIGKNPSPAIQSADVKKYHVHCDGYNILSVFWRVTQICKREGAELIHSFDTSAFLFGRLTSSILRSPHLFTKCGGPNPGKAYPTVNNMVCYSHENISAFKARRQFQDSEIFYIPNRVNDFDADKALITELEERYRTDNALVFMRIARVGQTYERGFYQSIRFMELLKQHNIHARLVIVGAVENEKVYQRLKDHEGDFVLLTDKKYTDNAKKLIEFADCIIATGRGVMEAVSKKKIIFIPSDKTEFPVLLDSENFTALLDKNFSPRVDSETDQKKEIEKVRSLIEDVDLRSRYEAFIYSKYDELFNINTVIERYESIYQAEKYVPKKKILNFFRHLATVLKSCLIRQD